MWCSKQIRGAPWIAWSLSLRVNGPARSRFLWLRLRSQRIHHRLAWPLARARLPFPRAPPASQAASVPRPMEAGAGMATMQSHAAAAVGRRSAILGGREKRARAGSLRIGGPAGAEAMAVRTRGTKPVAPLCCVRAPRGELSFVSPSSCQKKVREWTGRCSSGYVRVAKFCAILISQRTDMLLCDLVGSKYFEVDVVKL